MVACCRNCGYYCGGLIIYQGWDQIVRGTSRCRLETLGRHWKTGCVTLLYGLIEDRMVSTEDSQLKNMFFPPSWSLVSTLEASGNRLPTCVLLPAWMVVQLWVQQSHCWKYKFSVFCVYVYFVFICIYVTDTAPNTQKTWQIMENGKFNYLFYYWCTCWQWIPHPVKMIIELGACVLQGGVVTHRASYQCNVIYQSEKRGMGGFRMDIFVTKSKSCNTLRP